MIQREFYAKYKYTKTQNNFVFFVLPLFLRFKVNFTEYWLSQPGHYCNRIIDPGTCCPLGHSETDKRFCTCKVSPEMARAVRSFEHELYLESWRQYDKNLRKWILRNHKWIQANYISCRESRGSGPLKDGKCCFCGEEVDWVLDNI